MRYTSCLDLERQARLAVLSAEKRRDDISRELINVVDNILTQHPSGYSSFSKSTAELEYVTQSKCLGVFDWIVSSTRYKIQKIVNLW